MVDPTNIETELRQSITKALNEYVGCPMTANTQRSMQARLHSLLTEHYGWLSFPHNPPVLVAYSEQEPSSLVVAIGDGECEQLRRDIRAGKYRTELPLHEM